MGEICFFSEPISNLTTITKKHALSFEYDEIYSLLRIGIPKAEINNANNTNKL